METTSKTTKGNSLKKAAVTVFLIMLTCVLWLFLAAYPRVLERTVVADILTRQWTHALAYVIALVLVIAMIWFFRRVVGKGCLASLGFSFTPEWWLHFLVGTIISLGLFAIFIALQYLFGQLEYTGTLWQVMGTRDIPRHLLAGVISFIVVGINEEIYFRGYLYTMLTERHNRTLALFVSTLLFSLIHGLGAGFGSLVFVNILLIGAIFVLLRERTGSLWLPIGLHWMWDYAQFYVLAVSTPEVYGRGLLNFFQAEGVYGPEGTPAATIIFGLLFIFLVYERLRNARKTRQYLEYSR